MIKMMCALAVVMGASLFAGCEAPLSNASSESQLLAGGKYRLIPDLVVPEVKEPNRCGAQALATVIAHFNSRSSAEKELASLPFEKASPIHILLAARAKGFDAKISRGTIDALQRSVADGLPPIVMIDRGVQPWHPFMKIKVPPSPHWVVVSGVAVDGDDVCLAQPGGRHAIVERALFIERWREFDCCMIVVLPKAMGRCCGNSASKLE